MSFVPLICRCYDFLYIRFPFSWSFWEVPKYTLFASQKNREVRLSWVWYTILFFFSKAVVYWIPYYHFRSLLQEQRVSFFNWGILGFLSTISVHHLHNLAYHFHCFGVHSKFWGHIIVLPFYSMKKWKMWKYHLVLGGIMWKYRMKTNGIMWNIYVFIAQIMWKVLSLQL